jgi:hypothetical protein
VLARAGAPRLARSRPARAAVRMAGRGRPWPGPREWPQAHLPARRSTVRMRTRSACVIVPHPRTPANSAPGSTASSSPLPGARPVGSGKGRCARNGSARRVCRPVMDEHATSLPVDLGPEEGPPKPRPGAA